jgi:hypothetical protein
MTPRSNGVENPGSLRIVFEIDRKFERLTRDSETIIPKNHSQVPERTLKPSQKSFVGPRSDPGNWPLKVMKQRGRAYDVTGCA